MIITHKHITYFILQSSNCIILVYGPDVAYIYNGIDFISYDKMFTRRNKIIGFSDCLNNRLCYVIFIVYYVIYYMNKLLDCQLYLSMKFVV